MSHAIKAITKPISKLINRGGNDSAAKKQAAELEAKNKRFQANSDQAARKSRGESADLAGLQVEGDSGMDTMLAGLGDDEYKLGKKKLLGA